MVGKIDFLDINESLQRLVGFKDGKPGEKTPWVEGMLPCLTAHTQWVVRYKKDDVSKLVLRLLYPFELFAMMGWSMEHWNKDRRDGDAPFPYSLLQSLSGNAFNSFAFWPVFAAAVSLMGHASGQPATVGVITTQLDSCSSSEDVQH